MSTAALHAAPSSPHVARIEFGQTRRSRGGWYGTATIEYDGHVWAIDLDMTDTYLSDMVGFFEEIARPEWSGPTQWQSEFQELAIEAEAESNGLVKLAFSTWWSRDDELDNEREGELVVSRDELPQFAARLRDITKLQRDAPRFGRR